MDAKFLVRLGDKEYPLYGGVLSEAHERGLQAIETVLLQGPNKENEYTAIVKATVRMKDGSWFEEYGDASPRNTSARIQTALIRMAATRAKGRALRDAINCGQTLLEELPEPEGDAPTNGKARAREAVTATETQTVADQVSRPGTPPAGDEEPRCEGCGVLLTPGQVKVSRANLSGRLFCPPHQKEMLAAKKTAEGAP